VSDQKFFRRILRSALDRCEVAVAEGDLPSSECSEGLNFECSGRFTWSGLQGVGGCIGRTRAAPGLAPFLAGARPEIS
jgi:hypothetical protein